MDLLRKLPMMSIGGVELSDSLLSISPNLVPSRSLEFTLADSEASS